MYNRIAATSGCFDILHAGHVYLFDQMKYTVGKEGLVIVLVNDDDYLQRIKGRVITPLGQRIRVLKALRDVDVVLSFSDDDPRKMIDMLKPDYWYKGPEYQGVEIIEREVVELYGGTVICPGGGPGDHTSDIIRKIQDHAL